MALFRKCYRLIAKIEKYLLSSCRLLRMVMRRIFALNSHWLLNDSADQPKARNMPKAAKKPAAVVQCGNQAAISKNG
ncbi:hypothetical protein [Paraburkholderia sp.]|uniref:hypothetical protein n=1 Tax=Paraburkholderia sp. TaxID=1926495 RepID=UPI0039E351B8